VDCDAFTVFGSRVIDNVPTIWVSPHDRAFPRQTAFHGRPFRHADRGAAPLAWQWALAKNRDRGQSSVRVGNLADKLENVEPIPLGERRLNQCQND
jgi:hypothetical protein